MRCVETANAKTVRRLCLIGPFALKRERKRKEGAEADVSETLHEKEDEDLKTGVLRGC